MLPLGYISIARQDVNIRIGSKKINIICYELQNI